MYSIHGLHSARSSGVCRDRPRDDPRNRQSRLIDPVTNLRTSLIAFTEATTGRIRVRPVSASNSAFRKEISKE